jgi:WD40 repeat protein
MAAAFTPDGKRVLTVSDDSKVHLTRVFLNLPFETPSEGGTFFPRVRLWDATSGHDLLRLQAGNVFSGALSADGKRILTLESPGCQFVEVRVSRLAGVVEYGAGFRPAEGPAVARVFDAETGRQLLGLSTVESPPKPGVAPVVDLRPANGCFSPDGKRILVVTTDGAVIVFGAARGDVQLRMPDPHRTTCACFSPDGNMVLCVEGNGEARLRDAMTGKLLVSLQGGITPHSQRQSSIKPIDFSPDGRRLAAASGNGNFAKVWDTTTGRELASLDGHQRTINSVRFSSDGPLIVTASDDETARIWEAATGKEIYTLSGHKNAVRSAVFSPDGTRVATASADGTARIWLVDPLPAAIARKPRELSDAERRLYEIDQDDTTHVVNEVTAAKGIKQDER